MVSSTSAVASRHTNVLEEMNVPLKRNILFKESTLIANEACPYEHGEILKEAKKSQTPLKGYQKQPVR